MFRSYHLVRKAEETDSSWSQHLDREPGTRHQSTVMGSRIVKSVSLLDVNPNDQTTVKHVVQMTDYRIYIADPDLKKRCPSCTSALVRLLGRDGYPSQVGQCSQCPSAPRTCWLCLFPWQSSSEASSGPCRNQSCQLVDTLLTCDKVTDPTSHVLGCPVFRACLLMHTSGCKYMHCSTCQHGFCFICLRRSKTCGKAKELYWSLSCSKPKAGRQIFSTVQADVS